MSPEEVRVVVETAIRDELHFPWWSYFIAFSLSMAGAYFGSYVKRKAEDRATQENFEELRNQLKKTTQDTEEIKGALSRKNWLTQQQWAIREQHYMSLLMHLTKLKLSLEDRSLYFMQPGSEYDETCTEGERFQSLARVGHETSRREFSCCRAKHF